MHRHTTASVTTDAPGSPTAPACAPTLRPSRSWVTLHDLDDAADDALRDDASNQAIECDASAAQQSITLVQKPPQPHASSQQHVNKLIRRVTNNARTRVLSLKYASKESPGRKNAASSRPWTHFACVCVALLALAFQANRHHGAFAPTHPLAITPPTSSAGAAPPLWDGGATHGPSVLDPASPAFVYSGREPTPSPDRAPPPLAGKGEGMGDAAPAANAAPKPPQHSPQQQRRRPWGATRDAAPMLTEWGASMAPEDVGGEGLHPRPQLTREGNWVNLNGFWDYCILREAALGAQPSDCDFSGEILVPFAVESALSGVMRNVSSAEQLVYRRTLRLDALAQDGWGSATPFPDSSASSPSPSSPHGDEQEEEGKGGAASDGSSSSTREGSQGGSQGGSRYMLHFGAVDWKAWVWLDGHLVGVHEGGFDPFSLDITPHLDWYRDDHELVVAVWDPTEEGTQPRGKQWRDKASPAMIEPSGMWYTSVTGIWQTVWLERVPSAARVEDLAFAPDLTNGRVLVDVTVVTDGPSLIDPHVTLIAWDGDAVVGKARGRARAGVPLPLSLSGGVKAWSPESPFLYDLTVELRASEVGAPIDVVRSYFGMREVTLGRSGEATQFLLNGSPAFQYGVLDQGWWPDGLYTAPSESAMIHDILRAKEFGFNVIRKHAKVEPSRFYYWCDVLGIMVWQDMPSTSGKYMWHPDGSFDYKEGERTPESANTFMEELTGVMRGLRKHPSVVAWIPFNEGWGQFNTHNVFGWMQAYDPTRLVWVSGGNDFGIGSAFDRHVYPGPDAVRLEPCRASVIGEFGGNGYGIREHVWPFADYESFVDWGYAEYGSLEALSSHYVGQMRALRSIVGRGLAGAIYTQLTDVESELNGLMTYDRRVVKLDASRVREEHATLYAAGREPKVGLHSARWGGNATHVEASGSALGMAGGNGRREGKCGWE